MALASAVGGLAAILAVGNLLIDRYRLDAVDREYARRIELLDVQRAAHPDRPMLMVVGSSRMVMAFAPEQLPPLRDAAGTEVLPFNFSHFGAGPVFNRVVSGRLSDAGVRPKWVLLEIMPAFFPRENVRFVAGQTTLADVAESSQYIRFGELGWEWFRHRTVGFPAYAQRATRPPEAVISYAELGGYTGLKSAVPADVAAREMAVQTGHFGRHLKDWTPAAKSDRAFRDMIAQYRGLGADVRILLSPEGTDHRKLYGPGCEDRVTLYANGLSSEMNVPVIDARRWLADGDFADGHHVLTHGAAKFTARL
ncbi:MAG: hypothetical protein ACRC7O_10415, partial [Fimbriiglobus sp.]